MQPPAYAWFAMMEERTTRSWTVEQWLRYWLSTHTAIRATTKLHYRREVDNVLIPYLGRYGLADLDHQDQTTEGHRDCCEQAGYPPRPATVVVRALGAFWAGRGWRRGGLRWPGVDGGLGSGGRPGRAP